MVIRQDQDRFRWEDRENGADSVQSLPRAIRPVDRVRFAVPARRRRNRNGQDDEEMVEDDDVVTFIRDEQIDLRALREQFYRVADEALCFDGCKESARNANNQFTLQSAVGGSPDGWFKGGTEAKRRCLIKTQTLKTRGVSAVRHALKATTPACARCSEPKAAHRGAHAATTARASPSKSGEN